ncbi:MAG: TetR/AcrR family transcriptional regulator [Acidobacteria bacterium]|nr:TetR/AcrR family transcriptional regulator [Acidobacteriota bacterium]
MSGVASPTAAPAASPGRPRRFTRGQVVAAAIAVLQERGPEGLTMKALSARLGTGVGTIYSYAASKDELMLLVATEVLATATIPEPTDDWEGWLRALLWNVRDAFRPYPWMDHGILGRPSWTEAATPMQVAVLKTLEDAGFSPRNRSRASLALYYLSTGFLLSEPTADRAEHRSRSVTSAMDILMAGLRAELAAQRPE